MRFFLNETKKKTCKQVHSSQPFSNSVAMTANFNFTANFSFYICLFYVFWFISSLLPDNLNDDTSHSSYVDYLKSAIADWSEQVEFQLLPW